MIQQINNEKFANAIEKTYSHIGNCKFQCKNAPDLLGICV
jgi:hypothetical protein